jgi:hypothetical protein
MPLISIGFPWSFHIRRFHYFCAGPKPRRGHYISVETMPDGQIVTQVSLFLHIRYMMRLLSVPLTTGHVIVSSCHFFDVDTKEVISVLRPVRLARACGLWRSSIDF